MYSWNSTGCPFKPYQPWIPSHRALTWIHCETTDLKASFVIRGNFDRFTCRAIVTTLVKRSLNSHKCLPWVIDFFVSFGHCYHFWRREVWFYWKIITRWNLLKFKWWLNVYKWTLMMKICLLLRNSDLNCKSFSEINRSLSNHEVFWL